MAENVTDYGAVGDGQHNDTEAFIDAARAAGASGTVEIPAPPSHYLVDAPGGTAFQMPSGRWDDQTWVGIDGYDTTEIRMQGGQGGWHFMFEASDGQGSFTVKNLTFDMNKDAMSSNGWGSQIFHMDAASGTLTARDCVFKNSLSSGIKINTGIDLDVQHCGFEDIGWQDPDDGFAAHSITLTPDQAIQSTVKNCYFDGDAGAPMKVGDEGGNEWVTALFENCWSSAARMAKIDPDNKQTTFKNCYHEMQGSTSFPDEDQGGIAANIDGLNHSDLIIDNVNIVGPLNAPGVSISAPFSNIEVRDLHIEESDKMDTKSFGSGTSRGFINVDPANYRNCTVMSVKNVGSNNDGDAIFITDGSSGDLGEVRQQGTTRLGSTGGVAVIEGDSRSMVDPVVPAKSDVGPRTGSDGTSTPTGSGSTDTTSQYGGYATPEAGRVDWHLPLNQNFNDIEADVKDLAARLDRLEGN